MAAGKPASRMSRNSTFDEAPSSQVKLKDVNLGLVDERLVKLAASSVSEKSGNPKAEGRK